MTKYVFYYYFQFGLVCCAKAALENGRPVGGELNAIPGNIHEITEQEWMNYSLFDLKGKYEYVDGGKDA